MIALNPELYERLSLACRKGPPVGLAGGKVIVLNRGREMSGKYVDDVVAKNKMRLDVNDWGETYKVCCPYCGDARHRLYINHRWGTFDQTTGIKNYHLVKCFNEDCQSKSDFFDVLTGRLHTLANMVGPKTYMAPIQISHRADVQIDLPGPVVKLSSLSKDHPAIKFLTNKKLHPKRLEENFNVFWCDHSKLAQARHRIIAPWYEGTTLKGWQARYVDLNGSGNCDNLYICSRALCGHQWLHQHDLKPKICPVCAYDEEPPRKVVKWYTCPGAKTGETFFNWDKAQGWPFFVITEGPNDVFKMGTPVRSCEAGPVIASFNHVLTQDQKNLLYSRRHDVAIVLMYDQDVWSNTLALAQELKDVFKLGMYPIELPTDTDPGDLKHADSWNLIRFHEGLKHFFDFTVT